MEGINQIGKEVLKFHFYLRWVHHVMPKDSLWPIHGNLSHWLPQESIWSQEGIWSFTAVGFFDFEFFPVKGETPEFCQI